MSSAVIFRQLLGYVLALEMAQVILRMVTNAPPLYRWDDLQFSVIMAFALSPFGQMCVGWGKDKWSRLFG